MSNVAVTYNPNAEVYVIDIDGKKCSIDKQFVEDEYPYNIIEEYGYKQYGASIAGKELNDFINHIDKEVVSKLSDQIDTKSYLHLLDHEKVIKFDGDSVVVFGEEEREKEVGEDDLKLKLNKQIYFLKGKKRSSEKLAEMYKNTATEVDDEKAQETTTKSITKYTEIIKNISDKISMLTQAIRTGKLSKERENNFRRMLIELNNTKGLFEKTLDYVQNRSITDTVQLLKNRAIYSAQVCDLANVFYDQNIKSLERLLRIDTLHVLTRKDWADRIFNNTLGTINPVKVIEELSESETTEASDRIMNEVEMTMETSPNQEVNNVLINGSDADIEEYFRQNPTPSLRM